MRLALRRFPPWRGRRPPRGCVAAGRAPSGRSWPACRSAASAAGLLRVGCQDDLRAGVRDAIGANAGSFQDFLETREMSMAAFQELARLVCPGMGPEEAKALFVSMDASGDGQIQEAEMLSDITMAVLRARREYQGAVHPLEGSYLCLPRPPFSRDPLQLQAISKLTTVYDEVVAASSAPVPRQPATGAQEPVRDTPGYKLSGLFGGLRAAAPRAPAPAKRAGPAPPAPQGAYLYGGCGCGKTVLLDLFFRSLPDGFAARRLHWHEFLRDAFRGMRSHPSGKDVFEAMGELLARHFRVLLLDELHVTHISEAILVKNLFRELWAHGVTVVTTSNYLPEELYAGGFNRSQFEDFIPELSSQCPVFDMGGGHDYRKMDVDESPFFFFPLCEDSAAGMDEAFRRTVVGDVGQDLELPIPDEARSLRVPLQGLDAQGARVARFSFAELCSRSLGRADYSAIAETFHTVFLDGVPKFKPDLGAEFRRFVSLTDILYGKKVAVYLQSEVHTDALFEEGLRAPDADLDERWAFRRCTSMLSEMQSPKYHHMVWLMRNHLLQEEARRL